MGALAKTKKTLTPKQIKALVVLSTGSTYKKAAEVAGVSEATIGKWVRLNHFHREFTKAMERMRYQYEARAIAAGQDALAVVHKELQNDEAELRLKAGATLVNNATRLGTRYKELEVSGALPAPQPMIIFPTGTTMPWNSSPVKVANHLEDGKVVDAEEVKELPEGTKEDEDTDE
jgi:hypothetical protein